MPQTSAAKGALRQSERRRAINDRWRSKLRSIERQLKRAFAEQNAENARTLYVQLQSTVDRMARRHILHRNTAARVKSRFVAKLSPPVSGTTPSPKA